MTDTFYATAFGLRWLGDTPLPLFAQAEPGEPDVIVSRVQTLQPRIGGRPFNRGEIFADGVRFRFDDAVFDTFGGSKVRWWSEDSDAPPIALYSTVTSFLLAWRDVVPLHASAVEVEGRGLLIAGPSGSGKSTLVSALAERGCGYISDDLSVMACEPNHSHPVLLLGRPAIRLSVAGRDPADKVLHVAKPVSPDRPIPLSTLIILQSEGLKPGPAGATEALAAQLFRPSWMRELPNSKRRLASIFLAAQRITIASAPAAVDRPQMAAGEKADRILQWLAASRRPEEDLCFA